METTSYQNRLRAIGVQLDREDQSQLTLLEVPGGFIARVAQGHRLEKILEFTLDDFAPLLQEAQRGRGGGQATSDPTRLFPTGYQDGLRAIGYLLDQAEVRSVLITEMSGYLMVSARAIVRSSRSGAFEPFEHFFTPEDMAQILDEAFRRRKELPRRNSVLRRIIGNN